MTTRSGRQPLPTVLGPALLGGVFFGPTMQVVDVLFDGVSWSWRRVLLAALFYAIAAGLAGAVAPAVSAAARERIAVARAVSAGALPGGAGPEWRGRLAAEEQRLRSTRNGVPGMAVLLAAAVAVIALQVPDATIWLCVAGLLLTGGLAAVVAGRRLRTVDRLAAELGSRTRV